MPEHIAKSKHPCSCGALLWGYILAGPLYEEYVVSATPENVAALDNPPPETTDDYANWWDFYHTGDLLFAASIATAQAWQENNQQPLARRHDIRNRDGSYRYQAPAHEREITNAGT